MLLAQPSLATTRTQTTVPFVGCEADGQVGPLDKPKAAEKTIELAPEPARQLAYYKAEEGPGVLAPRGWFCFEVYGSNGSSLYISPQPIHPSDLFADEGPGFTGPVVELNTSIGDTSGRFGVAWMIARVFPAHHSFVRSVVREGLAPADTFHNGPFPQDKLIYKSQEMVEFMTPAKTDGLGTSNRIRNSLDPIEGTAILVGPTPDLLHLSLWLPPSMHGLTRIIVDHIERESTKSGHL